MGNQPVCPISRAYEEIFDSLEGTDGDVDIDEDDEDSVPEPNEKFTKTS